MSDTNPSAGNLLSPEMYSAVFSGTSDALLWIRSADGEVVVANPAAGRIYGCIPTELTGMRLRDLAVEPDWTDRMLAERPARVPLRYHRRIDGRHFPVEMQLRFSAGAMHDTCLVTVRDLSERLAAESHLQNVERMYQGIFGAAPYPILIIDSSRAIIDANTRALELYGIDRNELCAMKLGELLADPARANDYAVGREGTVERHRHRRPDGGEFLAEATLSVIRGERGLRTIIVIRDVTEETRFNEQLQASEERWRFALEGHGSGLMEWLPETDEMFVSRRFSEQLGYREGELPPTFATWESLLHPDDFERSHRALLAHLTGEAEMVDMEVRLRNRDGEYRWIKIRGKAMTRDATGRVQRLIGMAHDITAEHERDLRERLQEEQLMHTARLANMGEMATVLAHEINQPLAAIGNFTSAALRRLKDHVDDPEVVTALGNVVTLVERAGGIVQRIRDFTRKGQCRPEPIDINGTILDVIRLIEPQSQMLEARIVLELASDLPQVSADRLQVGQLVLNLAKNGLEAMADASGPRRLTVRSLHHADHEIEIRVEDNGCGLPEQMALDVITPFFTTKANGLGMGLVICRTIVENHGGRLWATPASPRGTVFHAILPVSHHD